MASVEGKLLLRIPDVFYARVVDLAHEGHQGCVKVLACDVQMSGFQHWTG